MLSIPFLRPGKFISSNGQAFEFDDAQLADIASYDPNQRRAPLLVGHGLPLGETEASVLNRKELAFGLVDGVKRAGSYLVAQVSRYSPQVKKLLQQGQLPGVSMKLWHPQDPANPTPGKYSLRHLALLGTSPPAVSGLPEPSFGEFETGSEPEFELEFELPVIGASMPTEENLPVSATIDHREAVVAKLEAELQRRELEFAARQEGSSKIEELVVAGKIPPAWKAGLVSLRTRLAAQADAPVLEFALGDEQVSESPVATLDRFLASLPQQIEFAKDVSGGDTGTQSLSTAQDYANAALEFQATEAQRGVTVTLVDAYNHVLNSRGAAA